MVLLVGSAKRFRVSLGTLLLTMRSLPTLIAFAITVGSGMAVQRQPWSFAPVTNPAPPTVLNIKWAADDLDRFVLARLEAAKLSPQRDADRYTLLRRASFDVTGLPPTAVEIAAFVNDPEPLPRAFARVVDRLLDSPRFGERWARHWLDAVRYADSVGQTWNAPFVYAHRYRDYVIAAFNADKPYDRFVREQVAGDLLPVADNAERRANLTATGFLTLGSMKLVLPYGDEFRLDRVDDQIDVTSRAIMGLTVSCARCHDHKYEPISQQDYYALAGIFMSTDTWPGQRNRGGGGPQGYVDQEQALPLPVVGVKGAGTPGPTVRAAAGTGGGMMAPQFDQNGQWNGIHVPDPNRAMGVSEARAENCALRIKGEPFQRGPVVPRGALRIPGLTSLARIPEDASGRLQLADWLVSRQNPLTARVMVNRIWQHLFGRGIVPTVDNFGSSGERPTHPELLDHLATRFMQAGWSVKGMLRALLLSRTYRMSSATDANNALLDQANENLWRMEPRRLELEAIRDALLQVGGSLQVGPPPGIPVAGNGGKGRFARTRSLIGIDAPYRTVFLPVLRDLLPEMHQIFDFPNPSQIKGQREVTTVPPQSLYLLNNALPVQSARNLAQQLLPNPRLRSDAARIGTAWLATLSRLPEAEEVRAAKEFMNGLQDAATPVERWTAMLQALLVSTEFRYVQ